MKRIPQLRRCLPLLTLAASLQITLGYYDPAAQRWINRDPIGERGGINSQSIVSNKPTEQTDPLGLYEFSHGLGGPIFYFCRAASDWLCAQAAGASVLAQLKTAGIDGNDDRSGGNAFRRCLVACQASKACGAESAQRYWDGREDGRGIESQQDLANNKLGYSLASQSSCWDACMNAWSTGALNCLGKPCPARRKPQPVPPSEPGFRHWPVFL
jgi:uncharacterized protein RhaS with RHS repeats